MSGARFGLTSAVAILSAATAFTLAKLGPAAASAVAVTPWLALGFLRSKRVLSLMIFVLSVTAAFGRDFSYLKPGPLYILDFALILFLALAVKEIGMAVAMAPFFVLNVLGIVVWTAMELVLSGVNGTTVRESVIGLYAAWAIVGLTIAAYGLAYRFARWLVAGAVVGLAVFGTFLVSPTNVFSSTVTPKLVAAAASLYASYVLLAVLFTPDIMRRYRRVTGYALAVVALVEIAAGEVRSVWVALAVAIPATFLVSGLEDAGRRGVARLIFVGVLLVLAVTAVAPRSFAPLHAEAVSIYGPSSHRASSSNAQWRLSVARVAIQRIKERPVTGVGFGTAETFQDSRPADLHNSIVAFGLRLGIPGFLLMGLFETAVLLTARRFIRRTESLEARGLMIWLAGCQIVTAVHSLFTVVLEGPYMGIFFWLFGGLIVGLARSQSAPVTPSGGPRPFRQRLSTQG